MIYTHIGPLPPPLGGISVYLYRLSKIDTKDIYIDEKVFFGNGKISIKLIPSTIYFFKWYLNQLLIFRKKIYVYHSHLKFVRFLLYLLSIISKHEYIIVIHGHSIIYQYKGSISKIFIRLILDNARLIQVVNQYYKDYITNVINTRNNNILVKNAFLPPPLEEEDKIIENYSSNLVYFFKNRKPLILANAGSIRFYNNIDIYGLDLCVDLIIKLKLKYPNIGFIFALADSSNYKFYLLKIIKKIKQNNIEENFYFLTGQKEIWPLFKKVDFFIRPTYFDGTPVSILEARNFNCPVIASDCSPRPSSVILFKNRDLDDLYLKVLDILKK
ncbi:hypothetical protein ES705_41019 [subsurface metagenome]